MRTTLTIAIIAAMLLTGTGIIAASSFTTATLERSTSIDVVADDSGFIALTDGTSGDIVQVDGTTGELKIDFAVASATGVNVNSIYELGDPNNPTTEMAFNITNNDGVSHTFALNYTVTSGDGVGDGNSSVKFEVYDSTGTLQYTETEETNSGTFTATSGETFYVVVTVDTTPASIDQSSDLSGTLEVTAT